MKGDKNYDLGFAETAGASGMKILCLYANDCAVELWTWLKNQGNEIVQVKGQLDESWCKEQNFDLTVSYTYPYLLRKGTIAALNANVVNLHTSFLPYNRGASPNIWSIIDDTPRGVTLHYIDNGVDTGDIISQCLVPIQKDATLESSYKQLDQAGKKLFMESFEYYDYWNSMRKKSLGQGTFHTDKDFARLKTLFQDFDWTMEIDTFLRKVKYRR